MRKALVPTALLLTAALLLCGGCAHAPEAGGEAYYTFTDDVGRAVTLTQKPRRVAVLFSSYAEMWLDAGGEIAVTVGESVERGFVPETAVLADGGAGKTVNTEVLAAARPDLVIASADIPAQVEAAALLSRGGIPAACFRVEGFDDYLRVLKVMTDITGRQDCWRTNGLEVQAQVERVLAAVPEGEGPRVLFIRAGSTAASTKAKAADQHFAAAMLTEVGAVNIADEAPLLLDGLSPEAVLAADPDMIFISTMGDEQAARANVEAMLALPQWQALTAVQQGSICYLPKELFQFKPNARWAQAYQYLTERLYDR